MPQSSKNPYDIYPELNLRPTLVLTNVVATADLPKIERDKFQSQVVVESHISFNPTEIWFTVDQRPFDGFSYPLRCDSELHALGKARELYLRAQRRVEFYNYRSESPTKRALLMKIHKACEFRVKTEAELAELDDDELLQIPNFGKTALAFLRERNKVVS